MWDVEHPKMKTNNNIMSSSKRKECFHRSSLRRTTIGSMRLDPLRAKMFFEEFQQVSSLRLYRISFTTDAVDSLALSRLNNLKNLSLYGLSSRDLRRIFQAGLPPSLESLTVAECNISEENTTQSLGTLLRRETIYDIQSLSRVIEKSTSLKQLEMSSCSLNDLHWNMLLHCIPDSLESLNLCNNRMETLNTNIQMKMTSQLRCIHLQGNPIHEHSFVVWDNLQRMLIVHPLLGRIQTPTHVHVPPSIQQLQNCNRSGERVLFRCSTSLPLSIWPRVLERANLLSDMNGSERANAIFRLLHGPALLTRPHHEYKDYS